MRRLCMFLVGVLVQLLPFGRSARSSGVVATPMRAACASLPSACFISPDRWTETDKMNLDAFLRTPSGTKFLHTLHELTVSRALTPVDRSPFEHGITGGFSVMLGEIERLACEGESENSESEDK